MGVYWTIEEDLQLRRDAIAWLTVRSNDGSDPVRTEEIADFRYRGAPMPLLDRQRGIRKPAVLEAALSLRTAYRPAGAVRPYEDGMGPDGLVRYKYRGTDPAHPENRALRVAMERVLPLIWFLGVGPGLYLPRFPVFVVGEERAEQQFVIDAVTEGRIDLMSHSLTSPMEETLRRYLVAKAKHRLHQPIFRAAVMHAYQTRCAVCALGHSPLLDAAHIVPDHDEAGIAAVRNGLALCKIHHAALDARILGVRPDLVVEIRDDLLKEADGPMLRHGLQERHGQRLMVVPRERASRPDPGLLEIAYARFREAG